MTAGVTAGAACSCSDTIGNLKVGHMVGANPRRQFISQMFGVLAGAVLAVPAYFILVPDPTHWAATSFPRPRRWSGRAWRKCSRRASTRCLRRRGAVLVAFAVGVSSSSWIPLPQDKPYTPSPAALASP